MWVDHTIKVPDDGHWYAVVRVDEAGNTELVTYLSTVTDADIIAAIDAKNRPSEATSGSTDRVHDVSLSDADRELLVNALNAYEVEVQDTMGWQGEAMKERVENINEMKRHLWGCW